jgi:hypothetical protein
MNLLSTLILISLYIRPDLIKEENTAAFLSVVQSELTKTGTHLVSEKLFERPYLSIHTSNYSTVSLNQSFAGTRIKMSSWFSSPLRGSTPCHDLLPVSRPEVE